jgi:hypothetical protein
MLPDFCVVAIGSWPLMMNIVEEENSGGQGPVWAVAPLDGWIEEEYEEDELV